MKRTLLPLLILTGNLPLLAQAPNTLPGLTLWLDAQDGSTISSNAGQVTQWADKSGNGFHAAQGDAARQPTAGGLINGHPSIRLDAAGTGDPNSDALLINDLLNIAGRPYTVYIVDQYWGGVQGRTLQGRDANWLVGKWGGRNAHFTGDWAGPFGAQQPAAVNVPVVTEGVGGTYNSYHTRDGVTVGHNNVAGNPGRLVIGGAGGAFDEPSQSDVGEVLIFNRVLADNERRQVGNYLSQHWGTARPFQRQYAAQTVRINGGDAGEGLDFQGNFVAAVNAGGPAVTVGDANFEADSGQITSQNVIGPGGWGTWNLGGSAADDGLENVLSSIRWSFDGQAPFVGSTVTGLVPGNTYKVQLLFGETCCGDRHSAVVFDGQRYISDLQQAAIQGAPVPSAGAGVVYQFVADAPTMTFSLQAAESLGGDRNPTLNGFTVENLGITGTRSGGLIASAASIDTTGSFLYALDFGQSASPNGPGTRVVNDAAFSAAELASGVFTYAENTLAYNRPEIGGTAADDNLEDVLHTIRWEDTASEGEVVAADLAVAVGEPYKLTLLFSDSNAALREFDVNIDGVRVWDNFRVGSFGGDSAFLTYEFSAPDGELNILLDGFTTSVFNNPGLGDDNPILSGLLLERLIPEPGTATLSLLSAAVFFGRRRRR